MLRRNVFDLAANDPVLTGYKQAIDVMRARDVNDPTSWMYQANIHGTTMPVNAGQLWNRCLHGSGHFLPWHRMYLYYFERIVRDASGVADWALPFWDYSAPGQNRLPDPFRNSEGGTNPLYDGTRRGTVNAGDAFPFSATTAAASLSHQAFLPSGLVPGFGGGNPQGTSRGALEQQPHNIIHVTISGNMGDPRFAGQDPIFWLHHCNIDRLWAAWLALGGGRDDPRNNASWMNASFDFYDETGTRVSMTNSEILETTTMGYEYDSFDFQAASEPIRVASAQAPAQETARTAVESSAISLGGLRVDQTLEPGFEMQSAGAANDEISDARYAVLVLEDARANGDVGVYYEIYLNLPDGETADPEGPYYVGVLDFFSAQGAGHAHGGGDVFVRRYDISQIAERLEDAGNGIDTSESPRLTFIANGMAETTGGALQPDATANPRIGSARIEIAD